MAVARPSAMRRAAGDGDGGAGADGGAAAEEVEDVVGGHVADEVEDGAQGGAGRPEEHVGEGEAGRALAGGLGPVPAWGGAAVRHGGPFEGVLRKGAGRGPAPFAYWVQPARSHGS